MIINVKVKTRAKENKIIKIKDGWKIYLKECAEKGRANKKLIDLLSEKFDAPKSLISIVSGIKSHDKLIEIANK